MGKGPKSIGVMCAELGMDAAKEKVFRNDVREFLKETFPNLANVPDHEIDPVAVLWLNEGGGERHFSKDVAPKFLWATTEHRLTILEYLCEIMKMQRWYAIDRLHHRIDGGAAKCPGCLIHAPRMPTPDMPDEEADDSSNDLVEAGESSEDSDTRSIHHIRNIDMSEIPINTVYKVSSLKRSRASHDYYELSGNKKRRVTDTATSHDDHLPANSPFRAVNQSLSSPALVSSFTAVNSRRVGEPTSAVTRVISMTGSVEADPASDSQRSIRYRGKQWHFKSVEHKAEVLERILLQEEKDVEAYPVLAFSKGAKKAAYDADGENEDDDNMLKDYFKFYTHFMNERFPENEKILLDQGVTPSAR